MRRTILEKVSLGSALFAWASMLAIAGGPLVLGHDLDCFPRAQSVLHQWSLLVLPAMAASAIAALAAAVKRPQLWRRAVLGPVLSVTLVAAVVVIEPFGDLVRHALGTHTDFCDCRPNGLLGYFPNTWSALYGSATPRPTGRGFDNHAGHEEY